MWCLRLLSFCLVFVVLSPLALGKGGKEDPPDEVRNVKVDPRGPCQFAPKPVAGEVQASRSEFFGDSEVKVAKLSMEDADGKVIQPKIKIHDTDDDPKRQERKRADSKSINGWAKWNEGEADSKALFEVDESFKMYFHGLVFEWCPINKNYVGITLITKIYENPIALIKLDDLESEQERLLTLAPEGVSMLVYDVKGGGSMKLQWDRKEQSLSIPLVKGELTVYSFNYGFPYTDVSKAELKNVKGVFATIPRKKFRKRDADKIRLAIQPEAEAKTE